MTETNAFIPDRKHAYVDLGHVLVLGLGVSGRAAVEYLVPLVGTRVQSLTVFGGVSKPKIREWASSLATAHGDAPLTFVFDSEDVAAGLPDGVCSFDVCIASPGISAFSDFYQNAQAVSAHVISEVEFAWCESSEDAVWVAITGTNGKTTTTALEEHILLTAGLHAKAVGNIGDACITQVARDMTCGSEEVRPYYVVETSSYQLASIDAFAPNVAVILGITPDHIKWHKTHEHYAASKLRLLDNLADVPHAVAVLDATNDEVRCKVRELRQVPANERGFAYIPLGAAAGIGDDMRARCGAENAAFVRGADLEEEASDRAPEAVLTVAFQGAEHVLCDAANLKILGTHNQVNALAAAAAAVALGVADEDVACALETFKPLEHRIEPAGVKGGVAYYNDSKATNVDATLQALKAFLPKKPIVMLGGDDKGTDLADLVESCRQNAKAVICYGEAGPRFYEALSVLSGASVCQSADRDDSIIANKSSKNSLDKTFVRVNIEHTFAEAFNAATQLAVPGDIVLLSPACASFDEFTCFEERGDRFKQLVAQLEG